MIEGDLSVFVVCFFSGYFLTYKIYGYDNSQDPFSIVGDLSNAKAYHT